MSKNQALGHNPNSKYLSICNDMFCLCITESEGVKSFYVGIVSIWDSYKFLFLLCWQLYIRLIFNNGNQLSLLQVELMFTTLI